MSFAEECNLYIPISGFYKLQFFLLLPMSYMTLFYGRYSRIDQRAMGTD